MPSERNPLSHSEPRKRSEVSLSYGYETSPCPAFSQVVGRPQKQPSSDAEPQVRVGAAPPEPAGCGGPDAPHPTWIFESDGAFTAMETAPISGVVHVD